MPTHDKSTAELDSPERIGELRALIDRKVALRGFYSEVYNKYLACLNRCPPEGGVVELGSGASFAKRQIPGLITSDTIAYQGVDQIVDATRMPFENESLRAIFMMNVFHHIPDVHAFLSEATRCLKPGGRVFILDQHVGWFSRLIFQNLHHEPFLPEAKEWKFASTGPLSGANGALAWIVFKRDQAEFERAFPALKLIRYRPHSPLRYWLSGGLKSWSLIPGWKWAFKLATISDAALAKLSPGLCSFTDIELVKD